MLALAKHIRVGGRRNWSSRTSRPNAEKSSTVSPPSGTDRKIQSPVYVHPLSQIVLQYFQRECHDWICAKNLERGLTIHRDGTFLIHNATIPWSPRIWTFYDPVDKKHWLTYSSSGNHTDDQEPDDKTGHTTQQHRFLLQDNLMPAWQGNRRMSLAERVQESVQELILVADEDWKRRQLKDVQTKRENTDN